MLVFGWSRYKGFKWFVLAFGWRDEMEHILAHVLHMNDEITSYMYMVYSLNHHSSLCS